MANTFQITVPDIGNFDSVEVIDVIVKIGDTIKKEDSLITVESDKASMDIPSTHEGKVTKIDLKVGDKVTAILKECNPIKERIQLSVRELTKDPLQEYQKANPTGTNVVGKIVEVSNKNITVQVADNIFGLVNRCYNFRIIGYGNR